MAVLRRADRQHHRVSFLVTLGDYTQVRLGSTLGFDARLTLLQCRMNGEDPYQWCAEEQSRPGQRTLSADHIIGVDIDTWLVTMIRHGVSG